MKLPSSNPIIIDLEHTGLLHRSEPLDYEMMEAAGFFQPEFALVPRSWAERHWSTWDRTPEDFRGPNCVRWYNESSAISVSAYCDFFWQRTGPTEQYLDNNIHQTAWAAQNEHKLEVVQNRRGEITDLYFRVDLRTDWTKFISPAVSLTRAAKCLLLDYEKIELVEPLERSVARRLNGVTSSQAILHRSKCLH